MGLARLLPLTTVALVIVVLTVSTVTLLWNGAPAQIEEGVTAVAASLGASAQDGPALQTVVDGIASSMDAQSLRVVDLDLNTLAYTSQNQDDVPEISESDARSLWEVIERRHVQSRRAGESLRVAAPVVERGQIAGALLMVVPADRLGAAMMQQALSGAVGILGALLLCLGLSLVFAKILLRPINVLDRAAAGLESYTFQPEMLNGLARRSNELGHVARLIQRTAHSEEGWRRSLEEVRQAKADLEVRVEERTRELRESLERQTAVGDVLKLISRSAFDLDAVTAELLESAVRLCDARYGVIYRETDHQLQVIAVHPRQPEAEQSFRAAAGMLRGDSFVERVHREGATLNVANILSESDTDTMEPVYRGLGVYGVLGVPLVQMGAEAEGGSGETAARPSGVMALFRHERRGFAPAHIELAQTFADQAAIALENVRLLAEIQQKTQQVEQLQIEIDEALRKKAVTEIVSTDYFQDIELKAKQMRERKTARRESQSSSSLYVQIGSPPPSEARPPDS